VIFFDRYGLNEILDSKKPVKKSTKKM